MNEDYQPAAGDGPQIVGIDLGGTRLKLGLIRPGSPGVERFRELATGAHRPREQVLDDLGSALQAMLGTGGDAPRVDGLGVAIPATFTSSGRIGVLPNFAPGWSDIDLAEEMRARTGLPSVVVNDARAFTLAEATFGAAKGARAALGVTLGTGVGGGLVVDGKLYLGPKGNAGELGHHIVEPGGTLCGCGSHGCLETVASATALVAAVTRPFLQGAAPLLAELTEGEFDRLDAQVIGEAARSGDPVAFEAVERAAGCLGIAVANVATLVGVETVVVGGGMAGLGEVLFEPLRRALAERARVLRDEIPEVRPATLGGSAGVVGSALFASQQL